MYNIAIVGDVHIDTKISSRKDDYFQTCLDKISEVADNCKHIIFLGDVFNRASLPNEYFSLLYTHLNYLKNNNGNSFYSIIGNHDIYNENEESLNKTSLGLCNLTGLIQVITPEKPLQLDNHTFYTSYVNLDKCKEHLLNIQVGANDILLLHQYFEDTYEGLVFDDIKHLSCNKIFLGHEHTPFTNFRKVFDNMELYRCGSLLRNSANSSNLSRDIFYFILDENEVKIANLECMLPASQVFTEKAYSRENLERNNFVKNINEVVSKYKENISIQSKFSIKTILEELNTPDPSLTYIQQKYQQISEVFN